MSIEYLGLSSINGPLIALEGVSGCIFRRDRGIRRRRYAEKDRPYRRNI